jgi:hypothetical protein
MEWLEFNRWSHEVEQRLAQQTARLRGSARQPPGNVIVESAEARAHRLQTLLRQYTRTNPWGHPVAES